MPLYDYSCRQCGRTFEVLVRGEAASLRCPHCASADLERLPSLFAVNSAAVRQASLTRARQVNLGVERDKAIAHEEYVTNTTTDPTEFVAAPGQIV